MTYYNSVAAVLTGGLGDELRILVTGGAGFVGSSLALMLAETDASAVTSFDNLHRRGSELALSRLRAGGVAFVHGDIRNSEDFENLPAADVLIECAAEPSVHAGCHGDIPYLVNTNLVGTFNCLEYARRCGAAVIFISTSRVYSIAALRALPLRRLGNRLALEMGQEGNGWSQRGIREDFPTTGARSLYGTTKLCSELLIEEYGAMRGLKTIINRCGVLTGPWQMSTVEQGFFVLWVARHLYGGSLTYRGFGASGHQVRDVLHIADLYELIRCQIGALDQHCGKTYNVGGGQELSISLAELTAQCVARTGIHINLLSDPVTHFTDIPFYVSDSTSVKDATGWSPARSLSTILDDVLEWLQDQRAVLEPILAQEPGHRSQ